MKFVNPRKVFLAYFTLVIVFQAASIGATENAGLGMLSVFYVDGIQIADHPRIQPV